MPNLTMSRLIAISRCRGDLLNNGLDLNAISGERLRELVRTDLEYFQLMLGDESSQGQVLCLIKWEAEMKSVAGGGVANDGKVCRNRAKRRR